MSRWRQVAMAMIHSNAHVCTTISDSIEATIRDWQLQTYSGAAVCCSYLRAVMHAAYLPRDYPSGQMS